MARIAGVDLPREKKIQYALPYIFGIGPSNAKKILAETGVNPDARVRDLRDAEVARLRQVIERDYKVEGALRTEVAMNIKRLMDIGTYRGSRHRKGLPVRGQRTHTNARTKKGPRRDEPRRPARARACAGPRFGARVCDPGARYSGPADPLDPRCDTDPAQWVSAAQEAAGLSHGTLHRARVQAVPSRGNEAVPQGDALSHREVRGRAARLRARPAWPVVRAAAQGVRISAPAARETEGQADLRAFGAAVPQHLRSRAEGARGDR